MIVLGRSLMESTRKIVANNLSPCPFCGGEGDMASLMVHEEKKYRMYFICCEMCAAQGGYSRTKAGAIRYWERRKENGQKAKGGRHGSGRVDVARSLDQSAAENRRKA